MNNFFGYKYIDGFKIDFFGWNDETDRLMYYSGDKVREAKRHYVCPFGGNPFPGTIIEWFLIVLPNGKKRRYNVYA